jgi:hypothetical protein
MPPPLPPTPVGHAIGNPSAKVVVEAFLDLNCPFSRKCFKTLVEVVQAYADKPVEFVFQQVIQPVRLLFTLVGPLGWLIHSLVGLVDLFIGLAGLVDPFIGLVASLG